MTLGHATCILQASEVESLSQCFAGLQLQAFMHVGGGFCASFFRSFRGFRCLLPGVELGVEVFASGLRLWRGVGWGLVTAAADMDRFGAAIWTYRFHKTHITLSTPEHTSPASQQQR